VEVALAHPTKPLPQDLAVTQLFKATSHPSAVVEVVTERLAVMAVMVALVVVLRPDRQDQVHPDKDSMVVVQPQVAVVEPPVRVQYQATHEQGVREGRTASEDHPQLMPQVDEDLTMQTTLILQELLTQVMAAPAEVSPDSNRPVKQAVLVLL